MLLAGVVIAGNSLRRILIASATIATLLSACTMKMTKMMMLMMIIVNDGDGSKMMMMMPLLPLSLFFPWSTFSEPSPSLRYGTCSVSATATRTQCHLDCTSILSLLLPGIQ